MRLGWGAGSVKTENRFHSNRRHHESSQARLDQAHAPPTTPRRTKAPSPITLRLRRGGKEVEKGVGRPQVAGGRAVAHLFPVTGVSPGITSVASTASEASFSCSSSKVHLFFSFSRSFSTRICSPALARALEPSVRSRRGTPRCARGDPDQLKGVAARRRGAAPGASGATDGGAAREKWVRQTFVGGRIS